MGKKTSADQHWLIQKSDFITETTITECKQVDKHKPCVTVNETVGSE